MQLAQLNIGIGRYPMDDACMQGFVRRIDAVNAMADRAKGFVWRLIDSSGDIDGALNLRLPGSQSTLVNMSVWQDLPNLHDFIYKTAHAKVMDQRGDYFIPMTEPFIVLWWVADGYIPSLDEAKAKLETLRAQGPSPQAFDFDTPFDADGVPINVDGLPVSVHLPKKDFA